MCVCVCGGVGGMQYLYFKCFKVVENHIRIATPSPPPPPPTIATQAGFQTGFLSWGKEGENSGFVKHTSLGGSKGMVFTFSETKSNAVYAQVERRTQGSR